MIFFNSSRQEYLDTLQSNNVNEYFFSYYNVLQNGDN